MPDLKPALGNETTEAELRAEIAELRRKLDQEKLRHGHDGHHGRHRPRPSRGVLWLLAILALAAVTAAFFAGYLPQAKRQTMLVENANDLGKEILPVNVSKVQVSPAESKLVLPGTIEAVTEAPLLSRASGYVRRRLVDIGDRVKEGQLLAEIEAPELDHQVAQARAAIDSANAALEQANANLQQAKANEQLYRTTSERYTNLLARGAVSKQETDNYATQYEAQKASVLALEKAVIAARSSLNGSRANLARLVELQGYQQVKAPFAGVITVRNVDVGALVNEGSTLLFRIAQTDRLRTYVNVPQTNANSVHTGMKASLTLPDVARPLVGTVTRTANALDPTSRTLLAEVQVENSTGLLMPGMYAQVTFEAARLEPPMLAPADALLIRGDGPKVARVMPNNKIHFQYVQLGRDYGETVEVISGLSPGDQVVINPGDRVQEGVEVKPVLLKAAAKK